MWNSSLEGNYWSKYTGSDFDQNGIGDIPQEIDIKNLDAYPLMGNYSDLPIHWGNKTYSTSTICNSTVTGLRFSVIYPHPPQQPWSTIISFDVEGPDSFCRVNVPKNVLDWQYTVTLDGFTMPSSMWKELPETNDSTLLLYMTIPSGNHEIMIFGTTWIPEFPTQGALVMLTISTLVVLLTMRLIGARADCTLR